MMINKIAIISFHSDPNYGTMLQAYALQKAIEKQGAKCEYLRYLPGTRLQEVKACLRNWLNPKLIRLGLIKGYGYYSFFHTKEFSSTLKAFKDFHKRIKTSKNLYNFVNIHEAESRYRLFIVGSDQTWSLAANSFPKTINFLEFVKDSLKKTAYAPSIGSLKISNDYMSKLIANLSKFNHLSCRERENAKLLSQKIGKKVECVLDPTFLLNEDDWSNEMTSVEMPKQYILCYELGEKDSINNFAENLGREKKLPVYYILTNMKFLRKRNVLKGISPSHFLWLVKYASYVVTDSFHGTIFCINFNVNFYSFAKRPDNESIDNDRILAVLNEFGLDKRYRTDNDTHFDKDIDFSCANAILCERREQSFSYLKELVSIN